MAVSTKWLQFLFVAFNGIYLISALTVIVLNSIFLYKILNFNSSIETDVILPCILLLVVGFLSLFFAWVGWKSAWSLHRVHIVLFGICLLLVVLMEFAFSVWSLVIRETMQDTINKTIEDDFRMMLNKTEVDDSLVKKWDKIQSELQCCGVGGPSDYRTAKMIPWSCCSKTQGLSATHVGDCGTIYQRGCFEPQYQVARDVMLYVCLTALGAALIQSVGLVSTYYLQLAIGRPPTSPANLVRRTSQQSSTRRQAPQPPKGSASRALLPSGNERY